MSSWSLPLPFFHGFMRDVIELLDGEAGIRGEARGEGGARGSMVGRGGGKAGTSFLSDRSCADLAEDEARSRLKRPMLEDALGKMGWVGTVKRQCHPIHEL